MTAQRFSISSYTAGGVGRLTVTHWMGRRVGWIRGTEPSRGERGRCGHLVAEGHTLYGGKCWDCMDRDTGEELAAVGWDPSKLPNATRVTVARSKAEYDRLRNEDKS